MEELLCQMLIIPFALGFEYQPIAKRYVANYKDGKWGKEN